MDLRRAVNLDVQPRRQCVDDGRTDTVEASTDRVRTTTELAARMEFGEHHLDSGELGLGLHVHRDTAAVVGHLHGSIRVKGHRHLRAVAGDGLIDRIVEDLPQAVHESASII